MINDSLPPHRYCIVGAGAGGLTAAKNFRDQGITFDCLERNRDIGGLWNAAMPGAAVHKATNMVSSKRMSRFNGFPMPANYPDFPNHKQVLDYFRTYAEAFDLTRDIQLNSTVERIEPHEGKWRVQVAGESTPRTYEGVVVANGHHHKPHWPSFRGSFSGEAIHVRDYVGPEQMEGKRVLIIGGGTSGCDVAVDAAQRATRAVHSMRRGYHVIPKYMLGRPSDVLVDRLMRWPLPLSLKDALCEHMLTTLIGPPQRYGMQKPDHRLFEAHPTISQLYPFYVGHQKIHTMPNIDRFEGSTVVFENGLSEVVDLIVYATGYEISIPFMDSTLVFPEGGTVKLLMNIFHPELNNLFFVGLIQVNGGSGWPLMDQQAKLIASFISARWAEGQRERWLERMKRQSRSVHPRRNVNSQRHVIEVRRYEYKQALTRLQAMIR